MKERNKKMDNIVFFMAVFGAIYYMYGYIG